MKKQPEIPVGMGTALRLVANKDALIPPIDGKQKYQIHGSGILRLTWIYIYPDQLAAKIEKYKGLKQWLDGPITDDTAYDTNLPHLNIRKHADTV